MTAGRLVSVLVAAFDAERYLGEAIESALSQTYRPLELVVVDDGSTDGTADVARRYGDRLTFVSLEHRGGAGGRNAAVDLASGDFFAFLDADDRFLPHKLERQMEALDADPALDIVYGHMREFVSPDVSDEVAEGLRPPVADAPFPSSSIMLVRRESFLRVGRFAEAFRLGYDLDWHARALQAGLHSTVLADVILERRLHASNSGIRNRDARSDYLHVLKAALDRRRPPAG